MIKESENQARQPISKIKVQTMQQHEYKVAKHKYITYICLRVFPSYFYDN